MFGNTTKEHALQIASEGQAILKFKHDTPKKLTAIEIVKLHDDKEVVLLNPNSNGDATTSVFAIYH